MTSIFELRRGSESDIFAVPYRGLRARKPRPMPDGAIVEAPLPAQRLEAPDRVVNVFAIAQGGIPATINHANLGLVIGFLPLSGIYLLPDGDVAAVYGAKAVPIGVEPASV